jgi:hypothetical protein
MLSQSMGHRYLDAEALPTEGDGALIVDDTGFAQQGHCSVGVARRVPPYAVNPFSNSSSHMAL